MSFECPTSPLCNTSADQKRKSKNAAKLLRYGSANLRDVLREKCLMRAKEARQRCYSQTRSATTEGGMAPANKVSHNTQDRVDKKRSFNFHEILREELAELDQDLELHDAIYNEMIEYFNEWFAQEVEDEANYLVQVAESESLVCPVCQVNNLVVYHTKDQRYNYRCKCNANFFYGSDMSALHSHLISGVDLHEQKCLAKLNFFVNPLTSKLEAICGDCDYLYSL